MSGGSPPEGTVTFLFSDIERSTELVRHVGEGACARLGALAEPGVPKRCYRLVTWTSTRLVRTRL
jgi:class 3 adenylate cyclase